MNCDRICEKVPKLHILYTDSQNDVTFYCIHQLTFSWYEIVARHFSYNQWTIICKDTNIMML